MKALKVVAPIDPEVVNMTQTCEALSTQHALDRFELAVKGRIEAGISDDNELRKTDELLHRVVLGYDALDATVKPAISMAHARHKALIAAANVYKERWTAMRDGLAKLILGYRRAKEDLERRQQAEIDRAASDERRRQEQLARVALRNGDMEAAKAAMDNARTIVAPVLATFAPVLDHAKTRQPWQVEVTNPEGLVKAIAAGEVPISAIKEFDLGFLKKEATKRGGLNWPGLRVWQEDTLAVSRK